MSVDDFARARKLQRRRDRAARATAWADKVSFDIQLTWPRDFLGRVLGLTMLLAPVGLLLLGAWLARLRPPRRGAALEAIATLVVVLVVCVVSFSLQAAGVALGWDVTVVTMLFALPSIALVLIGLWVSTRPRRASDDESDDEPDGAA